MTAAAGATGTVSAQEGTTTTGAGGTGTGGTTGGGGTTGAGGTAGGEGTTGSDGDSEPAVHYRFGGRVSAWQGREPETIADSTNPTLNLEAGQTYRVTWENLDGVAHNFTIQDSSGSNLASTATTSEEGATLTFTFTASEQMAQYICTIHPTTMVGDIELGGGGTGGGGGAEQEINPEEMGVPLRPHYVGIVTVLMMIVSLVYAFFVLKYGESEHSSSPNQ